MKIATCVHVINDNKTLMASQQFKIIGLKGFGGTPEVVDKTIFDTACRELWEETGGLPEKRLNPNEEGGIIVFPKDLEPVALIDFYNGTKEEVPFGNCSFRVLFFRTFKFTGNAVSTIEMHNPRWYSIKRGELPIQDMITGDEHFIQDVLDGKPCKGWMRRTSDLKTVLAWSIKPCDPADLKLELLHS